MNNFMLCKHPRTKKKLVIKAWSSRLDKSHWFGYQKCCVVCGIVVKNKDNKK